MFTNLANYGAPPCGRLGVMSHDEVKLLSIVSGWYWWKEWLTMDNVMVDTLGIMGIHYHYHETTEDFNTVVKRIVNDG